MNETEIPSTYAERVVASYNEAAREAARESLGYYVVGTVVLSSAIAGALFGGETGQITGLVLTVVNIPILKRAGRLMIMRNDSRRTANFLQRTVVDEQRQAETTEAEYIS